MVRILASERIGRNVEQPLPDDGLDFRRHQESTVGIRASGQRFLLKRAQICAVAATHIGIERRLVLDGGLVRRLRCPRFAADRGPRLLELDRFQPLRLRSDHAVEPLDFLLKQNVDRALF